MRPKCEVDHVRWSSTSVKRAPRAELGPDTPGKDLWNAMERVPDHCTRGEKSLLLKGLVYRVCSVQWSGTRSIAFQGS
jgi:hypothetical protein